MNHAKTSVGLARLDRVLLLLLIPGLLSALWLAAGRAKSESRNMAVELTLDYAELQMLSTSSGIPFPDVLRQFREAGVTGIALSEDTVGYYVSTGQASYSTQQSASGPLTVLAVNDPRLAEYIYPGLDARLDQRVVSAGKSSADSHASWYGESGAYRHSPYRSTPAAINAVGIGLPPASVDAVRESGFDLVARIQNSPVMTRKAMDASFAELQALGVKRLIFAGEEVLGFKGLVGYTAEKINSLGMTYGSIEFGKQRGDPGLSSRLRSRASCGCTSIPGAELASMTSATAARRFSRAVKERNIRLCYIRLPDTSWASGLLKTPCCS